MKPACAGLTDVMFPDEGDTLGTERALRFCRVCSIRLACLERALANREDHGVWGGMTPDERRRVLKKRKRRRAV